MVVVNKFSNYATFISCPVDVKVDEISRLFFQECGETIGMPKSINNDRDPRIKGKFRLELFKMVGTNFNF